MIVLGIDPGSRRTGWGCIRREGGRVELIGAGVWSTRPSDPLAGRLAALHAEARACMAEFAPDVVAVEAVFHGVNTRSLVVLGQARGALLAALGETAAPFLEMSPAEVKKAVTGRGGATKDQVAHMIAALLGPQSVAALEGLPADASDALAVAIAGLHRHTPLAAG